jgi:hypothetical protein
LLLALIFLRSAVAVCRRRHYVSGLGSGVVALLLFACAALAGFASVGVLGYRALTYEEVAAIVTTEPVTPQRFRATIQLPDRRLAMYELAGDAFYIDAHILKWHPLVNVLGLHTGYELDRVAGRYDAVAEERSRPRTVFSLARARPVDLFDVVRRLRILKPLLDAAYGSASFVAAARRAARFQVLVSTSGLLIREIQMPNAGR